MADIQEILGGMEPDKALEEIGAALKKLFPLVTDADRMNFVVNLVGSAGDDKVSSMVHL
jgi:hypothetical protein